MMIRARTEPFEAVFIPADPPRAGRLACYRLDGGPLPDAPGETGTVAVTVDAAGTTVEAPAVLCRPERACEFLLADEPSTDAARAWALAARKALELLARGRIAPGLDAEGAGAWRVAGIDGHDAAYLRRLADAMPPTAFAAPRDGHLPGPYRLLRAFLDAVVDAWTRGPAVAALFDGHALAADNPLAAPEFAESAAALAFGRDAGLGLALAVDPGSAATTMRVVLFDRADPERLIDRDEARLSAEDLRAALRSVAQATGWSALSRLATGHDAFTATLTAHDLAWLLDVGDEALRHGGVEVRWNAAIDRSLTASLRITAPPEDGTATGLFALDDLLSFEWRAALGGRELTEDELSAIADAHGPLARLGERWVLIDAALRDRLRRKLSRPAPLEALRAALTGTVTVGGQDLPVDVVGPLAAIRDRLQNTDLAGQEIRQPPALAGHLRDYQLRGLAWLTRLAELGLGACLADDMGLGKTITLIAHHLNRQSDGATAGPTLVVCPATLMANWAAEIARFAPDSAVRRHHGKGRSLESIGKNEFVLTTYATMRRDAEALAAVEWGLVCADEAQHAKNPSSATAQALRSIDSGARVALTGTPVENNLTDLWSILDWTTPGLLGGREAFREAYGRAAERGDADAAARLGALVRPFMLRRLKTDPGIAPELPAKTVTDQHVSLSREQVALYKRVVDESMAAIRSAQGIERRGQVLALLTRLKQICNHPAHYSGSNDPADGKSGKLELLDELLDTLLAEGEHALVFTQYTKMGELLATHLERRGIGSAFLHGKTTVRRREAIVADFQDGRIPVLLLSLKAAGVGLNLTRATHVVHFDRWWNPAVEEQATDRAFRIGQTRAVQVHRMICEGTLEERVAALLEQKRELAESVVGSGEAALTELSDDQLHELVRLETMR